MLGRNITGADLTHLDQCFLVIVRPQGSAKIDTHNGKNGMDR